MKTRIRSTRWRSRGRAAGVEDNATALAYVIWQIALASAKNLHAEDFEYDDDRQRIAVIAEYLIFLVHIADRLLHGRVDDVVRTEFVTVMGRHVGRHYQRNVEQILGHGDYHGPFVDLMNERIGDYAGERFADETPGFGMLRAFGARVQAVMGNDQTNRWVIDQVMDIDGPDAVAHLRESLANLFGTSDIVLEAPEHLD